MAPGPAWASLRNRTRAFTRPSSAAGTSWSISRGRRWIISIFVPVPRSSWCVEAELFTSEMREKKLKTAFGKGQAEIQYHSHRLPSFSGLFDHQRPHGGRFRPRSRPNRVFCMEGIPGPSPHPERGPDVFQSRSQSRGNRFDDVRRPDESLPPSRRRGRKSLKELVFRTIIPRSVPAGRSSILRKTRDFVRTKVAGGGGLFIAGSGDSGKMKKALGKGIKAFIPEGVRHLEGGILLRNRCRSLVAESVSAADEVRRTGHQ